MPRCLPQGRLPSWRWQEKQGPPFTGSPSSYCYQMLRIRWHIENGALLNATHSFFCLFGFYQHGKGWMQGGGNKKIITVEAKGHFHPCWPGSSHAFLQRFMHWDRPGRGRLNLALQPLLLLVKPEPRSPEAIRQPREPIKFFAPQQTWSRGVCSR